MDTKKTLKETMDALDCENYYIVEINNQGDNSPEYFARADRVDPELFDYKVIDHDVISNRLAIIYLDTDEPEPEPEEVLEEMDRYSCDKATAIFVEATRNLVSMFKKPTTIIIDVNPTRKDFTVEILGASIPFKFDEE